jgi:hypothetical protein
VVHLARFTPVGAEKSHPADDALRAEQLRQRFFIAQPVLQGQDLCPLPNQRSEQISIVVIGKGLEPHQHQIHRPDLLRGAAGLDRGQLEISVDGKYLQAVAGHCVVIPPQQEMHILPAPL